MNKKPAFTLIEAVITLVILLLLGLFALSVSKNIHLKREKSRRIDCMNQLKSLGLCMRMYSNVYGEAYPYPNGRKGLQLLAEDGFLENTFVYVCPSTNDSIPNFNDIHKFSSYSFAGGMTEASAVDSGIAADRSNNHSRYGNILFIDGHVKGYSGSNWSTNRGGSNLSDFY